MVLRKRGPSPGTEVAPRGSTLSPGAEIGGRYQIERLLGAGGMAKVWLAEDLERKTQVAFKEMLAPQTSIAAELEASALLFRREYYAMRKLQHPGTVKVLDCGFMETGNRYITMEVVDGEDLSDVVERAPMSSRQVRDVLARLAQILSFVHSRLFVHCDIKPENVRLTESGELKLMDFGIMHPLGTRASSKVWGTPEYMAPEWRERGIIDGRSDLYSMGVLAFFLLTGASPPMVEERGDEPTVDLASAARRLADRADHDPALTEITLNLLRADPRDRYASAAALSGALSEDHTPSVEEPIAALASYLHVPTVVGRAAELRELEGRLEGAKRRSSRALFIGAPAGVGKSRLLQELELEARSVDLPFALGQCRAEGLAARAPIEQALRVLLPLTPNSLLAPLRPALGRLLPHLADPTHPPFRDAGEEKIAVFRALSRWLRELSELTPFVLCLEDLHWADSATLELMNVVVRALHRSRGLVLATFRSDELSRLSLAFQTVDEQLADYLELAPLSAQDLVDLVGLTLQGFPSAAPLAHRLYEATRGNVFFTTECLRALIEEGTLRRSLGAWTAAVELPGRPLPQSIKEVVLTRLGALAPPSAAFLRDLAPAGRVLDMPLIQAVAEVAQPELFQLLDDAVERQFLQYVDGRYFFTHATVHEAIYDSTDPSTRRRAHGRIAAHLSATHPDDADVARSIGYHFARSEEPVRAITPLLRAGHHALENKAMLEAFEALEEAAALLERHPHVPKRDDQLIAAWGALIEVGYHSNTPACLRYAAKLFAHWDAHVDLALGEQRFRRALADAEARIGEDRRDAWTALFAERSLSAAPAPEHVFLKRAEHRIIESIALAITGRTTELAEGLARTEREHPPSSPYRAAAHVAIGGLTAHNGHFRGAVSAMRGHVETLRTFLGEVERAPRRLEWALGMGAYLMNMNLALMGLPIDDDATRLGFAAAERLGFTDLRVYHVFSRIVRASLTGDASAFQGPFAEMHELMNQLGNPRLPERNLAIYTPPYYLERGEVELARAVVDKGARLAKILPGDRWLALYVQVYRVCLRVLDDQEGEERRPFAEELDAAVRAARGADFRMETLLWVYASRHALARGDRAEAETAARRALARATDPLRENPFDELLARRALADTAERGARGEELHRCLALAAQTGNVLQEGIAALALGELEGDPDASVAHFERAAAAFGQAGAERWLPRVELARERPR
ncbi:MAG: protein kinase [Kofleriaceae bacterium]